MITSSCVFFSNTPPNTSVMSALSAYPLLVGLLVCRLWVFDVCNVCIFAVSSVILADIADFGLLMSAF